MCISKYSSQLYVKIIVHDYNLIIKNILIVKNTKYVLPYKNISVLEYNFIYKVAQIVLKINILICIYFYHGQIERLF